VERPKPLQGNEVSSSYNLSLALTAITLSKLTLVLNKSKTEPGDTMTQRRDLLTASTAGMLTTFFSSASFAQQQSIESSLSEGEKANILLVDQFCQGWEAMDLPAVLATMKTDAIYRQSQDTPAVTGHQGIYDLMQPWIESSHKITYEVLETFARGPVVINRRIDIYHSNDDQRHLEWEGVGLFLIEDGLIREWQDFTMRIQRGRA